MELFARTELDQYHAEPVLAASGKFMCIRWGWFSYAFLREAGDTMNDAAVYVDAIRALDE